jgi:two-component system cell cycle sensor histidine kinase/response regulator CckA
MLIIDPATAGIVAANPAACAFYGYKAAELTARRITDINTLPPQEVFAALARAGARQKGAFEFRHRLADGTVRDVEVYSGPIALRGRTLLLSIVHDVSERRKAESERREAERMLRTVLDAIPVRVFWKDLASRYLGCNRPFAHDAGLVAPEDLVGKTDFDMGWRNEAELYRRDDRAVMRSGEPKLGYEEPQTTPEGERIWLRTSKIPLRDPQGQVRGVLGTYEDITERKEAELRLHETNVNLERQLRFTQALLLAVPTPVFLKDLQGHYLDCNRAFTELTGLDSRAVRGKTDFDLWSPEHAAHARQRDLAAARHGIQTYETTLPSADGAERELIAVKHVFFDENGDAAGLIGAYLDITDRKRAEDERRLLEARMQQAQKLESLGVLAGGIAHDFNNLLTGVLGNVDMARERLPEASPVRHSLDQAQTAARRAAELAQQMLAYSGRGRFTTETIDLNRLVGDTVQLVEASISKKAELRFQLGPSLPAIGADAVQLRQVIMNLVINASEALGDHGGRITITTGVAHKDADGLSSPWLTEELPAGDYVSLEVTDTGDGMDASTLARVFDPFFSTKFTGRGLGLATVLGIVRSHRGSIQVDSEPGLGSSFRVLLPASPAASAADTPPEPAQGAWRGEGVVLVVDDEEVVRQVAGDMLGMMGFEVLNAADGCEAVEQFGRHPEIRCVLLDLTMPRMDGEETFRELRRLQANAKVILSSGYDEQEATRRFADHGLAGFVQKPYVFETLQRRLRDALGVSEPSLPGG